MAGVVEANFDTGRNVYILMIVPTMSVFPAANQIFFAKKWFFLKMPSFFFNNMQTIVQIKPGQIQSGISGVNTAAETIAVKLGQTADVVNMGVSQKDRRDLGGIIAKGIIVFSFGKTAALLHTAVNHHLIAGA